MSDPRAEALFREHGKDVLAYALRRTDPATADDVVAEVFVVALRRIERVPRDEPVLWLYGTARRVLANHRRAARRRARLADALSVSAPTPPEGSGRRLLEALADLAPADREVLLLTAWEGLDALATARVLGCSTGAVHTRLHRARARLRSRLDADHRAVPDVRPEVGCP